MLSWEENGFCFYRHPSTHSRDPGGCPALSACEIESMPCPFMAVITGAGKVKAELICPGEYFKRTTISGQNQERGSVSWG